MTDADQDSLKKDKDRKRARGGALSAAGAAVAAAVVAIIVTLAGLYLSPKIVAEKIAPNAAVTTTVTQTALQTTTATQTVLQTITATPAGVVNPAASTEPSTTTSPPVTSNTVYLADLQDAITDEGGGSKGVGAFKINGTPYLHSVGVEVSSSRYTVWSEYTLDNSHRTLVATLGLNDELTTDSTVEFVISGNGKTLYKKTIKYTQKVPITVDIAGMVKLRISATRVNGAGDHFRGAVFGDASLTG